MSLLIENCRLLSPGTDLPDASIFIEAGKIKRVFRKGEEAPAPDETLDASGLIAMPGFIDVHAHGAAGYDVMDADPAGFAKFAEAKLKEGVTCLLPTTVCHTEAALEKAFEAIAASVGSAKYKGPRIPGVHLEGPFVNPKCAGAQNPAYIRKPGIEELKRLSRIVPVKQVTFAAEMDGAKEFLLALKEMGIEPSCGHSAASYAQFKELHSLGLRHLTHFCNQMSPLHHRDIGLVGAGLLEDDVLLEMICDRMHLSEDMIRLAFKVKNRESIALITDSISGSWLPDGDFSLGGLPASVSGGAARLKSNGALAGSVLRFNHAFRNVLEITGLPAKELARTVSLNQATALGLEALGRLEPGYKADIVLLDKSFEVRNVFVDGAPKV